MMRCVPNAKVVAAILTEAWMASTGLNKMEVQDIQVLQTGVQTA
jgi:hypothetical protein